MMVSHHGLLQAAPKNVFRRSGLPVGRTSSRLGHHIKPILGKPEVGENALNGLGRLRRARPVHNSGGADAGHEIDQDHLAALGLDQLAANGLLAAIVAAL